MEFDVEKNKSVSRFPLRGLLLLSTDGKRFIHTKGTLSEISVVEVQKPPEEKSCSQTRSFFDKQKEDDFLFHCAQEYDNTPVGSSAEESRNMDEWKGTEYMSKVKTTWFLERWFEMQSGNDIKLSPEAVQSLQKMIRKLPSIDQEHLQKDISTFLSEFGSHVFHGPYVVGGRLVEKVSTSDCKELDKEELWNHIEAEFSNMDPQDIDILCAVRVKTENTEDKLVEITREVEMFGGDEQASDLQQWKDSLQNSSLVLSGIRSSDVLQPVWDIVYKQEDLLSESCKALSSLMKETWYRNVGVSKEELYRRKNVEILNILQLNKTSCSLSEMTALRKGDLEERNSEEDVMWTFVRSIGCLDFRARKFRSQQSALEKDSGCAGRLENTTVKGRSVDSIVSAMDVTFAILHCSDSFLRQELLWKMVECRLAVPILLPGLETNEIIEFQLCGLRKSYKSWKSKVTNDISSDKSIVSHPLPIVSFLRFGKLSYSKSKLVNNIIGKIQGNNDHPCFVDAEEEPPCAIWSKGTLEAAWFLPEGMSNGADSNLRDAVAFFNLRGNALDYPIQQQFAWKASDVVVALIGEEITPDLLHEIFDNAKGMTNHTLCILPSLSQCTYVSMEGLNNVKTLYSTPFLRAVGQDICKELNQVFWASQKESERKTKFKTIESLASVCNDLNIQIDEQKSQCQQGKQFAEKVKESISYSAEKYKATHLPLQGTLWKEWSGLDSKWSKGYGHQRFDTIEHYHDHLKQEMLNIRTKQLSTPPSNDIVTFIDALKRPRECRQYFLAWLTFFLNYLSFTNLGPLYKQLLEMYNRRREIDDDIFKLKTKPYLSDCDEAHLEQLVKRNAELAFHAQETSTEIDSLSLGVEHYIRELGQYFEANEDLKGSVETNVETPVNIAMFPEIAADLLIDGQPLEILDGDVGRVPIKWVKAVLRSVNDKLGGDVKICTISVLGIQSSGKSTLLNSMFGVKFAVGAGRCTRGVFIQLVKVHESLAKELSWDYLIVIDTEGLRAPGRSFQDDFRHDNELATFALCLADFTLINIAGQTVGKDMTDVLQIAAHAAIRMKLVHIKSSCCIIQQFVADPAAFEKNEASMLSILKLLDDATAAAAKNEGCGSLYTRFSDVFNLKRNEELQYIPSLWQGSMAPPNHRYSETITRLKRFIIDDLKHSGRSFEQFAERVLHVWNAVKEENFIFNFKNCEIALRYKTFQHVYGKWVSEMRQAVIESEADAKQHLKTAPREQLHEVKEKLRNDITDVIKRECKRIQDQIVLYLKENIIDNDDQLHKYEDEFLKDLDLTEEKFTLDASKTLDRIVSDIAQLNEMDVLLPKCRNELREKARTHAVGMRMAYLKETPFDDVSYKEQMNAVFEALWESWIRPICKRYPLKEVTEEEVRKEFDMYLDCQGEKKDLSRGLKKRLGISRNRSQVKATKSSSNGDQKELIKKLIIKPLHDLEEDIDKDLAFEPMIIRKLVDSAINIVNEDYVGVTLTLEDKVDALLEVCEQAVPIILGGRRTYQRKSSLEVLLTQEKEILREDFHSICSETFQDQRAVESLTNILNEKAVDVVRNDLGLKIYEAVRESCPYFNSRFSMFGYLLEDLAQKEEFNSYYKFLFELEEFLEEWSLHNIAEVCVAENREGKSLIEKKAEMKIADIREQLLICITSTIKNANALDGATAADKEMNGELDQTLSSWVNNFCKELRKNKSILSLPADDVKNLLYFKVKDISFFGTQVREHVEKQLVQTVLQTLNLPQMGNVEAAESMLLGLPTKPHKEIKRHFSGCTEQCPICHVPCDNMTVQHEKHRAELHYPEGLIGCATARDDCLACAICTSSVTTDEPYWDGEKRRKYRDYQKDFPTWVIQPVQNDSPLKYWKWVMQRFNKDLAQLYGHQEAKLPEGWLRITKQEAIEDLREAYATKRIPDS